MHLTLLTSEAVAWLDGSGYLLVLRDFDNDGSKLRSRNNAPRCGWYGNDCEGLSDCGMVIAKSKSASSEALRRRASAMDKDSGLGEDGRLCDAGVLGLDDGLDIWPPKRQ